MSDFGLFTDSLSQCIDGEFSLIEKFFVKGDFPVEKIGILLRNAPAGFDMFLIAKTKSRKLKI